MKPANGFGGANVGKRKGWLGDEDSNLGWRSQSPLSYR